MRALLPISRKSAAGFTLVEVLVALVVLSIGLLGIASLQLSSLRWNHGASKRSQATLLAYDILDRMRANPVAARAGQYTGDTTAGTVATGDLSQWRANIVASLGAGSTGTLTRTLLASGAATFIITVTWTDAPDDPTNSSLAFKLRSQL